MVASKAYIYYTEILCAQQRNIDESDVQVTVHCDKLL